MYRSITLLVIGLLLFCGFVHAQDSGFGLGIIIGEPTGISAKMWTRKDGAICLAAGWSLEEQKYINIQGDYVFHNFSLIKVEKGKLPVYYGIGVKIVTKDETKVGIRVPIGIDYIFHNAPLDIFFEIAPLIDIVPETEPYINVALGIRFFFGK